MLAHRIGKMLLANNNHNDSNEARSELRNQGNLAVSEGARGGEQSRGPFHPEQEKSCGQAAGADEEASVTKSRVFWGFFSRMEDDE